MPSLSLSALAAQYGYAAEFFTSDPELNALIQQAVRGQWTPQVFQGRFMATNWYRARTAAQRTWRDLEVRDPAEATRKINDKITEFRNTLSNWGTGVTDTELIRLARSSLEEGWSGDQVKIQLASKVGQPGGMGGTPATLEGQIKKLAGDYGTNASDGQLADWVNGMLTGRYTQDNVTSTLKDMAKSKYQGMGDLLDKGFTVRQAALPYIDSYSRLLEKPADTVDLNDNLIQQALQGRPGAPNQPPQMQTVYEFERSLRRDSRWLGTKNARDATVNAAQSIAKDWGLVG